MFQNNLRVTFALASFTKNNVKYNVNNFSLNFKLMLFKSSSQSRLKIQKERYNWRVYKK